MHESTFGNDSFQKLDTFHYTNKGARNAIRAETVWPFRAFQPNDNQRPLGAYFTDLAPTASPHGQEVEPYDSASINDFAVLRHLGTMEINGNPVLDGFYALRTTRKKVEDRGD